MVWGCRIIKLAVELSRELTSKLSNRAVLSEHDIASPLHATSNSEVNAVVDAGASDNYIRVVDASILSNMRPCTPHDSVRVRLPDGGIIISHATA